jgi:regulator of replication initiation timing
MAANPELYGQFESTQSLLNKYLPIALQNEQLSLENQQMRELLNQRQPPLNQRQPQSTTSVDSIIDLLTELANKPIQRMSFEEAQRRAREELDPMYADAARALAYGLDADMERRGLFNSPLAAGIMTEKQGQLSNDQIAAIAQRANQLMMNDQDMSLQEKQLRSNTLNSLLSSLIGREANIAEFTGYYGGQPTLANQKFQTEKEFGEAELTGNYKGQPTMASKAFDLQTRISQITNALNQVNAFGKVTTQEQADLLGVPVGTPSWQAQNAAAERQQELQMFEREMSYRYSSLSIQNAAKSAQDMLDNFNKDMTIWQVTGLSPDTEAMRYYGITPGTPWSESQSAVDRLAEIQAELELIYAEEELLFQNRATDFMNTYGVPRNVAEAAIIIIDQAVDYNSAYQIANANKSILQQENVNFATINDILRRYYNVYEKVFTPEERNINVNSGYRGPHNRRIMGQ